MHLTGWEKMLSKTSKQKDGMDNRVMGWLTNANPSWALLIRQDLASIPPIRDFAHPPHSLKGPDRHSIPANVP